MPAPGANFSQSAEERRSPSGVCSAVVASLFAVATAGESMVWPPPESL